MIERQRNKSIYELGMNTFDLQQAFQESEFDLLKTSEAEKTKFKLQQERDRWTKMLAYAKAGNLLLTDIEIKTIENLIAKIDQEFTKAKKFDFYAMFGLKPTDEERDAVNEIISTTISNLRDALAAEIELADIAIQKGQERVEAKQAALDSEFEARNKGYAFNVAQAQRELDAEKRMQEKALKEKEKLVKAQQRLDTISQASSLITAAANIWSVLSATGPWGIALAIAGIASMFGSFAFAKVKASQVTKAQAQLYGEGGFEELNGGSHASGNDINIGHTNDGRERKAEGGEGLAIIKKDKMRKYRGLVPEVINSINKGVFEKRFSRLFNSDSTVIEVNNNTANLSTLETEVKEIRKQGEKRIIATPDGRQTTYYKNLKITIKS